MLDLANEIINDCAIIKFKGDLSLEVVGDVEKHVMNLHYDGISKFVIDMTDVEFIDSRGAGLLMKLKSMYPGIVFGGASSQVRETLDRLMLTEKLKIFKNAREALKKI